MDSRDVLLRKEREKENYQRCSNEVGLPGLSRIFALLVQDEARHLEALHWLQEGKRIDLAPSTTLENAKSILRRLSMEEGELSKFRGDLRSFTSAMDFEAGSARVCAKLANETAEGWKKELLSRIAAEDEMHFTLLEEIHELLEPFSARGGKGGAFDVK
jgi:hypothetical protein